MPRYGGISQIRAGLGVRKLATEAGFRPTVSEDDILVSRFLERTASYLLALFVSGALCLIAALAILLNSVVVLLPDHNLNV